MRFFTKSTKFLLAFLLFALLVSVVLADVPSPPLKASKSKTDTANFDTNLSSADNTVQKALETLDEVVGVGDTTETNQDDAWSILVDAESTFAGITVTYVDATDSITFTVENDLNLYDWTNVDGTDLKTGSVTQAYDADLTSVAALTTTAYGLAVLELADEAALRALITTPWTDPKLQPL
jgi:hypothetical protein